MRSNSNRASDAMHQPRQDELRPSFRTLSVLMPIFNEVRTLRTIVRRVLASPVELEIELICVDDRSQDASWKLLCELAEGDSRIRAFRHETNRGKGATLRTALEHARGEIVIIQDADLEYAPEEFPVVLAPILEGRADACFGSRFATSPVRRVLPLKHALANRLLTAICNFLNNINLTDMETCYKAVRTDVLRSVRLKSERFGIEPEITTRLSQWGARIYEVPISYYGRTYAEGKNIGWRDGVEALWTMLRTRFFDPRFTKDDDHYFQTAFRRARRFHRWMLTRFESFVGQRVLEAGSGIGNFTELLLDRDRLVCVDSEPLYVELLKRRFGQLDNIDVVRTRERLSDATQGETFDTVISMNGLEHTREDDEMLRQYCAALEPGGHCIVLTPAHPWLFSRSDETLGHHRRYTKKSLARKLATAGFDVLRVAEFNRLGAAGWLTNKLLRRRRMSALQLRLFGLLLPLAKLVELLRFLPGLSVIAVARRPTPDASAETSPAPTA